MKDFAAYCVASYFMARRLSDNYVDNLGEIDDVIQKATLKMPEGVQIILQELNTDSTFSQLDTKSLLTLMGAKKRTLEQEKTIKRMSKSELSKYKALIKLFEKPLEEISGQLKRMPYGEISDKIGMEVTEQVTMAVRTILKGEGLGGLHYLTLGITAVLIAETSRYPVSFLVTLCMLDLIQLHTEEEKAVWKVFFAQNHGKASTLEGGVMLDILQTIGGMHPMTQGNSYYQVREYSPKLKHGMHWVDFKSHIILMKWLSILIENEQDLNPHLTAEITIKPEGNTNIVDDLNSWFGMNDMGALNPYVFDRFMRKLDTFDSMLLEKREPIRNIFPNNQADFEDFFESSMQYLGMMKSRLPTPVGHVIVDTIILPTIIGRLRLAYNQEPVDKESIKEITRCYAGVVSRDPYFYQAEFLLASIKLHCASSKEYNEEEFIEIFQIITHAILNIEKVGMGKELLYHDMLNLRDECAAKIKLELEKRFDVEVLLINGEASILFREEKFKEALNKYFEALQKLEEYKIFFPEVIGDLLENIGDTYSALNQPGLAIEKFKESLDEHMRYGPNDRAFCIPKKIVEQSGKLTRDRNEELKQEIKFILDSFKDKVGNHDLRLIPIKKLLISIYLVFHEYAEAIILFKEIGKENLSKKDKELWGGVEQKAQSAAQVIDSSTVVSYCNFIEYDNVVLNHPMGTKLLSEAFKIAGGAGVNLLLDLGQDFSIAKQIFLAVQEQGANAVLNRLLGLDVVSEDQNTQQSVLSSEYYSLDDKGTTAESSTQDLIVYGARLDTTEPLTDSNSYTSADSRASIFGHKFYNTFGWYLKQIIYHKEISQFKKILQRNNIDKSIDILLKDNHLIFKKSVLLKLHPDKGGNNEDFASIQNIQEKFNTPLDIKGLVDEKIRTIQPVIHKATIGFKVLDTVVDSGRLIYKPTLQNTKKAVLDCAYLYSMYQGINGVSVVISGSEAIYQIYQGEYTQAFQTVATTIAYTALPSILVYTAIPYLGVTYGTAIAIYTAYIAIVNSYSFYIERTSDVESILRSTMAYRDLTKTLSESPLQQIYDFVSITKGYEVELNSMALVAEKEALKSKLVEEKGEFGQKLYNYIYGSLIEERYNLLNKVELGEITQEVAENLKAKHMKVTLGNQSYEHCMEIRHIENNISRGRDISAEHYYCYDDKQKILDYVLIGDNHFEVVERL